MTTYYTLDYDSLAGGSFAPEGAFVTWNAGADSGFIITDIDQGLGNGRMSIALITGSAPPEIGDVLTQGGVTSTINRSEILLYPAYFREDVSIQPNGDDLDIRWTGPALETTHSFFFNSQTTNVVVDEILTFENGETCQVVTVESDDGGAGELSVRFISFLDLGLPTNGDTFTGSLGGDGTLNGEVYARGYTPLESHRLLSDLNDDGTIAGNKDLSIVDATASARSTDDIISYLGGVNIDEGVAVHMYGGSVSQRNGDRVFSGLDVQVTSPNTNTQPVLISDDQITPNYWGNAYFPDSIAGNVRILVETRRDGVNIDGQRVRGALLEFGDSFFFGGTTLGFGTTSLALFSANDGNNNTDIATVAAAPYDSVSLVEGFQELTYGESGPQPFALSYLFGAASGLQAYERTKFIQSRGTSELLFGRNAQLFTGVNRDAQYDGETADYTQSEVIAWGTEITFSGETAGPFVTGEVVSLTPSGARGRIISIQGGGGTGTLILEGVEGGVPAAADSITTVRGTAETTATVDGVVNNTNAGRGLLAAVDDDGATGALYWQALIGLDPVDNQTVFGETSGATSVINGGTNSRTVNNQFIGVFTGTNYQTNFGVAIDPANAIAGDQFPSLSGGPAVAPPDNRTGSVTNLRVGDTVTVYPWDGVSLDINGNELPTFGEMTLTAALVAGVSTEVVVGAGNIPLNTPTAGAVRVQRDSDGNVDLLEYTSINTTTGAFILGGATPTAINDAAIGNEAMRALIDRVAQSSVESYQATFEGGGEQVAITVRRGGTADPIVTFKTSQLFGGFSVSTIRTADS